MSEMQFDPTVRVIPHTVEAEAACIGSVIICPTKYFDVCTFLAARDFYDRANRLIWEAITCLAERGDKIDPNSVVEELRKTNYLDAVGGSAYIEKVIRECPTATHAIAYARLVEGHAIRRRMAEASGELEFYFPNTSTALRKPTAKYSNDPVEIIIEVKTVAAEKLFLPIHRKTEETLIGAVLKTPEKFFEVDGSVDPGDFFYPETRLIYQTFRSMVENRTPIDLQMVTQELEMAGKLDDIGGPDYLYRLMTMELKAHITKYGLVVHNQARVRSKSFADANITGVFSLENGAPAESIVARIAEEVIPFTNGCFDFSKYGG